MKRARREVMVEVPAAAGAARRRPVDLSRSGPWFAAFLLLALIAFWPGYLSQLGARTAYTHLHAFTAGLEGAAFAGQTYILYLQLSLVVLFTVFWAAAVWTRRRIDLHARFMVLTAITLIDPVVVRLTARLHRVVGVAGLRSLVRGAPPHLSMRRNIRAFLPRWPSPAYCDPGDRYKRSRPWI